MVDDNGHGSEPIDKGIDILADMAHREAIKELSSILVARRKAAKFNREPPISIKDEPSSNDIDKSFQQVVDRLNKWIVQ